MPFWCDGQIPDPQQPYSGTGSERHIGITIHPTTKVGDDRPA
jgi:hypothetical protein